MNLLKRFVAGCLMASTAFASQAATFVGARDDFRDETIYFAMTTRFYDGDPTNNVCGWDHQNVQIAHKDPDWRGDFKGLIDKLDYIKALGFTAIWITPIVQNASGTDFHGYHALDMSKVDLRYESRKEWGAEKDVTFKSLIDSAHAKDMKIVLDIVLNHTGNFGESGKLNHLFDRNQNIRNQASAESALIPDGSKFGSDYFQQTPAKQYQERFKYFKNPQYDKHNYYHHYGTGWNWDEENRWYGQIAGDCVDLNTEHPTVYKYLVDCYGKFIEMGVDGFRIDTTGHISRLTFNKAFIPQFMALGEKHKDKRLNGCPFYMFGECCARFGEVTYRNNARLSSYYYTWKSDASVMAKWNDDASWWDSQNLPEGHDSPVGNMALAHEESAAQKTSDNVFMKNGAWHTPDYSQASGYNVIDFPMHYNFNNAGQAVQIAKSGDNLYNDASYNVVYVDSHDYCPGPNDGTRFNGGTAQWAENLSLMFTFRGIPCIYYGSEVEFMKGAKVDAGGTDMPVSQSGRAYFGHFIEGKIKASDFGVYTADGNAAKTLNADLAQHVRRLNMIRAAVPALRKGQYTWDGCSANGGFAFKRAYKDSYALVAINGGATFSNVPAGDYTDIVTGKTYKGGGSITVDAPKTQGQLRVLVKDWKGGKVGEDGKFIYDSSAHAHGGSVTFTDPGATKFYTADDAIGNPSVSFSPAGGSFRTETLSVTAQLNEIAKSGWYKVGNGSQVALTPGKASTFTIGKEMAYGSSVDVAWSVTGQDGATYNGTVTYRKVDPNAALTVYVTAPSAPNIYAWGKNNSGADVSPCGAWPGKTPSESTVIDGKKFWYVTFDDMDSVNVIFNSGGGQTADITGITEDTYFEYDGGTGYKKLDISGPVTQTPTVTLSPNGGMFADKQVVTLTAKNATSAWYKVDNGAQVSFTGTATVTVGQNLQPGQSVTIYWSATDGTVTKTGNATYTKQKEVDFNAITIYVESSQAPYLHAWNSSGDINGNWPGKKMTDTAVVNGRNFWYQTFDSSIKEVSIIFNNGSGAQTGDITGITQTSFFTWDGGSGYTKLEGFSTGVALEEADEAEVEYYNLQGVRVMNPDKGVYVVRRGNKVSKVVIR